MIKRCIDTRGISCIHPVKKIIILMKVIIIIKIFIEVNTKAIFTKYIPLILIVAFNNRT